MPGFGKRFLSRLGKNLKKGNLTAVFSLISITSLLFA